MYSCSTSLLQNRWQHFTIGWRIHMEWPTQSGILSEHTDVWRTLLNPLISSGVLTGPWWRGKQSCAEHDLITRQARQPLGQNEPPPCPLRMQTCKAEPITILLGNSMPRPTVQARPPPLQDTTLAPPQWTGGSPYDKLQSSIDKPSLPSVITWNLATHLHCLQQDLHSVSSTFNCHLPGCTRRRSF